jgi:hypothetical protein
MPDAIAKCRCATLPQIVVGTTTKLPTKAVDLVTSKAHPANPLRGFGSERTWVALFRCKVCAQLWQADAWPRKIGRTSWPDLCIKIDTEVGWNEFDDRPLRLAFFPEMANKVSGQKCSTPKCGDLAVNGLDTCANCTCKSRHSSKHSETPAWGPWSPAHSNLKLRNGNFISLQLLQAVQADNEVAGVKAYRETFPNSSIIEARNAFAELRGQWP